jgi:outer membrane murein-binding lipoprotein Lpp
MTRIRQAVLAVLLVAGLAVTASAQQSVTQADIQRLQDNVYQAGNDVQQLRAREAGARPSCSRISTICATRWCT